MVCAAYLDAQAISVSVFYVEKDADGRVGRLASHQALMFQTLSGARMFFRTLASHVRRRGRAGVCLCRRLLLCIDSALPTARRVDNVLHAAVLGTIMKLTCGSVYEATSYFTALSRWRVNAVKSIIAVRRSSS